MNQVKIGKFIAECRKKNNLTQMQLAEKLNITDRAISKWENGKAMPDSSIMIDLCNILKISVNDLLSGEILETDNYKQRSEENIVGIISNEKQKKKRLYTIIDTLLFLICVLIFIITKFILK